MADVVVDASVAAKWQSTDEEHVEPAEKLRERIKIGDLTLFLPWFYRYEVASILGKAVDSGRIDEETARAAIQVLVEIAHVTVTPPPPEGAFHAARRFRRTVIDSFYLAIAEERGCDFWVDDRKLARALGPQYPFVRWIGDYPDPAVPAP